MKLGRKNFAGEKITIILLVMFEIKKLKKLYIAYFHIILKIKLEIESKSQIEKSS